VTSPRPSPALIPNPSPHGGEGNKGSLSSKAGEGDWVR